MTMRISKSIESVKKERAIIKEMSDYFTANSFDSTNPYMVEKLEDYLYRLFEINITDMGYEPRLIPKGQERDFYLDPNDEMKKVVNLSFCKLGKQKGGDSHGGTKFKYKGNMLYPQLRIRINSDIYDEIKSPIDIYTKIEALYHEMNHIKQFINLRNQESSFENLINGCAMIGIFKNNMYKDKYDKIPFESDSYTNFELFEHIQIDKNWFGGINQQILNFDYFMNRAKQNNPGFQDALLDIMDSNISSEDIAKCAILGKIYNADTTRKSVTELINNMNKEVSDIISNKEVDEYDKKSKIKDCKGMYYEIIYRALTKENIDSKKFEMIKNVYGEENDLIKDISNYFEEKRAQELVYINGINKIGGFKKEEQYNGYCNNINKNIDGKIEFLDSIQVKHHSQDTHDKNTQTVVVQQGDNATKTKIEDLDIVDQTQNQNLISPQKIKQDTIIAGVNFPEVNQMIREIKDKIMISIRGTVININEKEDSQNR